MTAPPIANATASRRSARGSSVGMSVERLTRITRRLRKRNLDRAAAIPDSSAMRSRVCSGSRRLIWLNLLLGSPDYKPLTRGIKAALPYIDDFMPVHNLASLSDLAIHRPERRHRQS